MDYDVLIAGAGPAGLSAAYAAARMGVRVAVLEKSKEIGYPIRTSGGSWIHELKKLRIPERFMHPIQEGVFLSQNKKVVFKYDDPLSCILDVRGLYQYLAELACAAGAEIFVNTAVTAAFLEEGKIAGLSARRQGQAWLFRAPLVIDATGHAGTVARKLGLSKGFQRVGLGAEYDLYAPGWPPNRVAFLFGRKYAPAGYAWVFPHHNNRVRLGVGVIRPDTSAEPQQYLEQILLNAHILDGSLSRVSRLEYHAGVIPSEIYLEKTVSDGVMIVGDAGGLISTLLGEGIRFAIDIGRMAGAVAAEAVRQMQYHEGFLRRFDKMWRQKYERIFRLGASLNRRLAAYSDGQWDRRLGLLSGLQPQLLPIILKGEFTPRNVMRIVKSNPEFLTTAVLSALKSKFKFT